MAEKPSKRQREETQVFLEESEEEEPKRHKQYTQILSLLDQEEEEEEDPNQDFSSILTTFQRELSCDAATNDDQSSLAGSDSDPERHNPTAKEEGREDEGEKVLMRHLLEASDDELGIPHRRADCGSGDGVGEVVDAGDAFIASLCDDEEGIQGLWEVEDEAANYYSLLQSELFM